MSDIYDFLTSWFMIFWLIAAGYTMRCGSLLFDWVVASWKRIFKKKP